MKGYSKKLDEWRRAVRKETSYRKAFQKYNKIMKDYKKSPHFLGCAKSSSSWVAQINKKEKNDYKTALRRFNNDKWLSMPLKRFRYLEKKWGKEMSISLAKLRRREEDKKELLLMLKECKLLKKDINDFGERYKNKLRE